MLRHVALRDRDEAREPRFRCEQIVVRAIEPSRSVRICEPVSDREDPAAAIVEKLEPHAVGERRRAPREIGERGGGHGRTRDR